MTVWLVQYRYDKNRSLEQRLAPGLQEKWQISPYGPELISREARDGDLVIIWRTVDRATPTSRARDDGGIVGWGRLKLDTRHRKQPHIYFEVTHAFPDKPVPRNEVYAALDIDRSEASRWPGMVSLLKVEEAQARILRNFLPLDMAPSQPKWHPLASGHPPDWASGWGHDEYGVFVEITVQAVTQRLRWCPPGRFLMGSPDDEPERLLGEEPRTQITFSEGFWIFETTVTQAFYHAVTERDPSHFKGHGLPVDNVSWEDAQNFLKAINAEHPGLDLRLPSEAEWEYTCRAGSTTPFEPYVARHHTGMTITSDEVNHDGNYPYGDRPKGEYRLRTVPVKNAGFRPNAWGFWHMHGNLWEWCADIWNDDHKGAAPDGSPRQVSQQAGEAYRVLRGGSWRGHARHCRSAYRAGHAPDSRNGLIGFRPARGQQVAQAGAAEPPSGSAESEA